MLTMFALPRCFFAVIAAVSRCYFPSLNSETQGFPRQRPIFPLFFSWNNSDNSHRVGKASIWICAGGAG